jgi:hypothetical protein
MLLTPIKPTSSLLKYLLNPLLLYLYLYLKYLLNPLHIYTWHTMTRLLMHLIFTSRVFNPSGRIGKHLLNPPIYILLTPIKPTFSMLLTPIKPTSILKYLLNPIKPSIHTHIHIHTYSARLGVPQECSDYTGVKKCPII